MSHDDHQRSDEFPVELKPIEAALSGLAPAAPRIDRDRLMYLAGGAAADAARETTIHSSPKVRLGKAAFWPLSTAALLLVSFGLGATLVFRQPAERIVYVDRPATSSEHASPAAIARQADITPLPPAGGDTSASADYLVLRDQVLRFGVEALGHGAASGNNVDHQETHNRAMLRQLLGS